MFLDSKRLPRSNGSPRQLVVFLHGYRSRGEDLLPLANEWSELLPDAEFVAPNGPLGKGAFSKTYGWFEWIDFNEANVRPGLRKVTPLVANGLKAYLAECNLTTRDLAIVGFSQGTMLALDLLFHLPGVRCLIGYSGAFYPPRSGGSMSVSNIMLVHGDKDQGVPYRFFLEAESRLKQFGLMPSVVTCKGLGHEIGEQGIRAGGEFLVRNFNHPKCTNAL